MKFTHAGEQRFTGLLVRRHLKRSVGLGQRAQRVDELGEVLHGLRLNSDGDHGVGIVTDGLEGGEVLVAGQGHTGCGGLNPRDGGDVAGHDLGDGDAVCTDHHGDLLHALGLRSANGVDGFTLVDGTGVNATNGHFTGVRVHPNLGDHHGELGLGVARNHGLADGRVRVAVPDVGDTVRLGLNRAGQFSDSHVEQNLVDGSLLSEGLLVLVVAVLENLLERDAGLLHVGHGDAPVVVCGAERHRTGRDVDLPGLPELFRRELADELVDLLDGLLEARHHVLRGHLKFVDEAVDLVDEEHRLDFLLQGLSHHGLGLRHGTFHRAGEDETAVNRTHGTGHVTTEVDVAGRVDEVDQEIVALVGVHHRCTGGVDGDATSRLLLVEVEHAGRAGKVGGHHTGTGDEVVRQRGLPVVDVSGDAEVADLWEIMHDLCGLLDVVFLTSHSDHLAVIRAT